MHSSAASLPHRILSKTRSPDMQPCLSLTCPSSLALCLQVLVDGRTGQALNLAGEKLPEGSVVAAVAAAAGATLPLGARTLREWAAREEVLAAGSCGDSAGHYTFYVECEAAAPAANGHAGGNTDGSAGSLTTAQLAAFASALDAALLEAAPAYGTVRGGMVAPLRVKLVAPGAFEGIRWVPLHALPCTVCV